MKSPQERRAEIIVAVWLGIAIVGAGVFAGGYAIDPDNRILGTGLGGALVALAGALITWSRHLMSHEQVEDLHPGPASADPEQAAAVELLESGLQLVARRTWLVRLGIAAATALGLAALFPIRSFGSSPRGRVGLSDWNTGSRLVRSDGSFVFAKDIDVGGLVTAFPAGYVGPTKLEEMGLDAVVVLHVDPSILRLPPERAGWTPQGYIAYSKICTHLGCPLGLYRQASQELMCPCHQSIFSVTDAGAVVFGPASRPLPQLPLAIDSDGALRAAGPMSNFVGADNWDYGEQARETVRQYGPQTRP
jgi:ubiquinol-cytochrome c reductase iron-sulfur subunit